MGEMTAVIAHEVRQPLTAIITNVDVASRLLDATNERLGELREIISDIRADDSRGIEVLKRIRDYTHKREARMTALEPFRNGLNR
jgi:signal transduction histidine kinase